MNKFFKKMMMALAGLTVTAALWAAPMTAEATLILGSQNSQTTTTAPESAAPQESTAAPEENAAEQTSNGLIGNGTVTSDSVRVRADASTSTEIVGRASKGTAVGVTGEKNDASGMLWYAVTFESEGKTVNGYIRSDLMSYEALPQAPAESAPTESAPTEETPVVETPSEDFYVQYTDAGTGTSDWYLIDKNMGKQYKISDLLSAQETTGAPQAEQEDQSGTLRVIVVILSVVILALIGVVTFLIIKLRNAGDEYEYDDEDEDEDEEEEDEDDEEEESRPRRGFFARRRQYEEEDDEEEEEEEDDEEEEEEPVRRAPLRRSAKPARQEEEEEDDEEEEYQPRRSQKASKGQKDKNWQSKNFIDDDDLEFEFLDLK